ncbi:Mss4-like protein [Triangularia verruculosa]|uniref:Mss4-like protein n=1 Tax=Triangularia verruculosa TaxID=2587418 RepID=A0AAN6XBG8_9PEZI|nr:Mss4-like protein [Triangularia verruculosa]
MASSNPHKDAQESQKSDGFPLSCECGYITMTTPSRKPSGMAHCHCKSCQKQSGSAFGTSIYYPTDQVFPLPPDLEAKLSVFDHGTDSGNTMRCYFCPKCGVRIMHQGILPDGSWRGVMSFKAGALDEWPEQGGLDWKAMQARHIWTRSARMGLCGEWEAYEKYPEDMATGKKEGEGEEKKA